MQPKSNYWSSKLKKMFGNLIQTGMIPKHVGIIMDGNRRFAKNNLINYKESHNVGFMNLVNILELLYESGIKHATVYAFSIENFKRPTHEVNWLMQLIKQKFEQITNHGELCEKYGIKVNIIGNIKLLPLEVQKIFEKTHNLTKNNNYAVLNVCFSYTSRDEMTHSIKKVLNQPDKNDGINKNAIEMNLYTYNLPPLDLLVRTSGTYRLSDFLLWQCVQKECLIIFVEKLWPLFTSWDMAKVLTRWCLYKYLGINS